MSASASRKRVIYQAEVLYVGPTCATEDHFQYVDANGDTTGVHVPVYSIETGLNEQFVTISQSEFDDNLDNRVKQLHRIQSAAYSFNIDRTDINQFGELAAIDRVVLSSPTVNLDFTYVLATMSNEESLGFIVDNSQSCIANILNKDEDEKNYFIRTANDGVDAIGDTTEAGSSIGIGNGFLTSYSSEASVGALPTVSVSVEALNTQFFNTISGELPSVTPSNGLAVTGFRYILPTATSNPSGETTGNLAISVLRPGDITLSVKKRTGNEIDAAGDYDALGVDLDSVCIQSYTLSFDLAREAIQCLGQRFADTREITFPVNVSMSIDALVGDLTTGNLADHINCEEKYDITVEMLEPTCIGQGTEVISRYNIKDARLSSESYSSTIGDNKTVTLEFTSQIGGPNQNNKGLFMSGVLG